ncbi:N-acetylglucosamine kinase [uncultured Microscilla sp.]|uniref:N-acetylglucosamine kinase n=1 Tax=uncultured Microscilla sp. TaxID=432653 RepID=UPI00260D4976|nr:N-acetylglucosamine kinase [uncultured Microscilla sp.]
MILIADSGSTKTDWRVIDTDKKISQMQSKGFNPNYDSGDFINSVRHQVLPKLPATIRQVHFYGAGCSTKTNCVIAQEVLSSLFPKSSISVYHDMLAAARALCGHQAGIACILGTGSNASLYDGAQISQQAINLGYLLGDEGSGYHLGKILLTHFLYGTLPIELTQKFAKRYPKVTRDKVLENLYHKPYPNRYVASFTKFLFDYQKQPTIYKLIYDCFAVFFDKHVLTLKDAQQHRVHFVGSIAFYFSNILRQVANDKKIHVGNVLETPIAGLTLYHEEQL